MVREILEHEHPVAIGDLDRCLRRYWDDIGTDDDRPINRALTMNLIAVAPAADESLMRATFYELLRTNPCIAMLVLLVDDDRPLEASFTTCVDVGGNSRSVLLELVTFHVGRREQRKVPSVIRPLLVDDLPTKALWCGALPSDDLRLLRDTGQLADVLVYDSSLFADAAAASERLEALDLPTADLAWARLDPWRQALAEAMEHVDWPPATSVRGRILHGGGAGSRASSALLARWLHDRLGAEMRVVEELDACSPSFEPCLAELTFDDVEIRVEHNWPAPRLSTHVTLADRCLVPCTTVSRCATRAELLADAAQRLSAVTPRRQAL